MGGSALAVALALALAFAPAPAGAACDSSDVAIASSAGANTTISADVEDCGVSCGIATFSDSGACVAECMTTKRGFSASCAACIGSYSACAASTCMAYCFPDTTTTEFYPACLPDIICR